MPAKKGKSGRQPGATMSSDITVKTAWLYYVEGFTQEQIARKLDLSRVKVMRTLAACTADGVVVTTINKATAEQVSLERALEKRWNLDTAIVVPTPSSDEHLGKSIGHSIAQYLGQQMQDGMTLAIGGGATLHASLGFLTRRALKRASVVALVGSLPHSQWINPSVVAAKVADLFEVDSYQITAPVIVSDPSLRDLLWAQPTLQDVRSQSVTGRHCAAHRWRHVSRRNDLSPQHRVAFADDFAEGKGRSRQYALLLYWRRWAVGRSRSQRARHGDRSGYRRRSPQCRARSRRNAQG